MMRAKDKKRFLIEHPSMPSINLPFVDRQDFLATNLMNLFDPNVQSSHTIDMSLPLKIHTTIAKVPTGGVYKRKKTIAEHLLDTSVSEGLFLLVIFLFLYFLDLNVCFNWLLEPASKRVGFLDDDEETEFDPIEKSLSSFILSPFIGYHSFYVSGSSHV